MMTKVGVFWVYKSNVVGRAVGLGDGEESVPGFVDSPDNHVDLWEEQVLMLHPELRGQEYFEIPRGRVLWDRDNDRAVVYIDGSLLNNEVKLWVARFFDLQAGAIIWRTDLHYNTNPESVEKLFND